MKFIKIIGIAFFVLIAAVILAGVILPQVIDPDDYKDEIIAQVEKRTGRTFSLEGDIGLSVFPWLGLDLGPARLGNAPGFGDRPFAGISGAAVRVKLMPLLKRRVEVDTVTLKGLHLNLERAGDGRENWVGLGTRDDDTGSSDESGGKTAANAGALVFAISGVRIEDATLSWQDRRAGSDWSLAHLNLTTGALSPGRPAEVDLRFDLQSKTSAVDAYLELSGMVDADPEAGWVKVPDLRIEYRADSGPISKAVLTTALAVDMSAQTAGLDGLSVEAAGLTLTGALRATQLTGSPALDGHLRSGDFNPRELFALLGQPVPDSADGAVLQRASVSLSLQGAMDDLTLKDIRIQLDDSTASGSARLRTAPETDIGFDLNVDRIDLDRYLPAPAAATEAADAGAPSAAAPAAALPIEALRALRLNGTLKVGELRAFRVKTRDVNLSVSARDGVVRLNPIGARLYEGSYRGDIGIDAGGKLPRITLDEHFDGVRIEPLLTDLNGKSRISGVGNFSMRIDAAGQDVQAIRESMNGNGDFRLTDGVIKGMDINRLLRDARAARAVLGGKPPAELAGEGETEFTEVTGTAVIRNGVLRNDDLQGRSPLLTVTGAGEINIAGQKIDYLLNVVSDLPELGDLRGRRIPVRISGPLSDPRYRVDLAEAAQEQIKQKLEEKVREKIGDKLKNILR